MAKFVVFYNGEHLKTYELDEPVISIGRLPENNISIANMGISRRHAKIEEDVERKYVLSDLNSLNGTYVNGKRIKKVMLRSGDKISIGKYNILYEQTSGISESPAKGEHEIVVFPPEYVSDEGKTESRIPAINDQEIPPVESSENLELSRFQNAVLIETNKHVVYKIDKPILTIGNGEEDDVFVSGFMIGRGQITIEEHDDGLHICAHKLMSKIKVNGRSTKSHLLKHKDRIEIGSSTFRFMENG